MLLASALNVPAQEKEPKNQIDLDLNMLGRGEMRFGGLITPENIGNTDAKNNARFLMERTRLSLGYKRTYLEVKVTAQHSGVWGEKSKGDFNLYEAWAKLNTRNGLFAQFGRQILSYDDERVIGANDWAMLPISHDVLKLGYEGYGHKVHAILGFNQNGVNVSGTDYFDGSQPYKSMQTLWYHYDVPKIPIGVSLLFMNLGMQAGDNEMPEDEYNVFKTEYQQMAGAYVSFSPKHWQIEASYYRQMGKTIESTSKKGIEIDAWMASIKAQYQATKKIGLFMGYDYLSGDDYFVVRSGGGFGLVQHKAIKYFNPVYGSNHKFYGMMDFFYVQAFGDTFSPGLQNLYAGVAYAPVKDLSIKATYHYLAMATDLDGMNKTLGHDVDFEATYRILNDVSVSLSFSYMAGSGSMKRLRRVETDNDLKWAWLSLSVSPRVISKKW